MAIKLPIMLVLLFLGYSGTNEPTDKACPLVKYCSDSCECQNYTSFKSLSFESCFQNTSTLTNLESSCLTFQFFFLSSQSQLILDQDFDWTGFMRLNKFTYENFGESLSAVFINLAGIDLNTRYEASQENMIKQIIIQKSVFNLLLDHQQVQCDNLKPNQSLAGLFRGTVQLWNVRIPNELCPEQFVGVYLDSLTIREAYMWKIRPKWNKLDNLNINITQLIITRPRTIKLNLDQSILNADMFAQTSSLTIEFVSLNSIYPVDLFKSFNRLKNIKLGLWNTRSFFQHTGGVEWIQYLNYNIRAPRLSLNNTEYLTKEECVFIVTEFFKITVSVNSDINYDAQESDDYFFDKYLPYMIYKFPEEDFCLFFNFPHNQLVVLKILSIYHPPELTCTLVSIFQYVYYYYQPNNMLPSFQPIAGFDVKFNTCRLEERTRLCNITPFVPTTHDTYFDSYDLKIGLDQAKVVLLDILGPVISLLGALSNSIIIGVIVHNKLKYKNKQTITVMNKTKSKQLVFLLDEPLYKYMLINAVLNELYCLIFLVDLSVECVPTLYYDYKIDDFKKFTLKNCLIKDIVIYYLASILKLTSNVMILGISINRYILLGKDHAKFMIKLAGLGIKKVFLVSLFASSLLSIIIIFQHLNFAETAFKADNENENYNYELNNETKPHQNHDLLMNEYYQYDINLDYGNKATVEQYFSSIYLIVYLSIVYYILGYVLFCIVSFIMDIVTVKRLRQVLKEHADMSKSDEEAKKKRTAEVKSFYMVLSFNFINFFFRLPDIITTIFVIVSFSTPIILQQLCFNFRRCLLIEQVSNISYIFSLSINLILYRLYYSTFKDCLFDYYETLRAFFIKIASCRSNKTA